MGKFPILAGLLIALLCFPLLGSLIQQGNAQSVTHDGEIESSPTLVGPATKITVLIRDEDLNQLSGTSEIYPDPSDDVGGPVTFLSDRSEVGQAGPRIVETGPNTGVFEFQLQLVTDFNACMNDNLGDTMFRAVGGSNPSIGVCPGDIIAIRYDDVEGADGAPRTVSSVVEVRSQDPEFNADKSSYNVDDTVTIEIADPDANRSPEDVDKLADIRVSSDSDAVGDEFTAFETGPDTGVFVLSFDTTSGVAAGAISVKNGDTVTIEYTDDFPTDFVEGGAKEFVFLVGIGFTPQFITVDTNRQSYSTFDNIVISGDVNTIASSVTTNTVSISNVRLTDIVGNTVSYITPGEQVVVAATLLNNIATAQPFTCVIEIKDSQGITMYLQWQGGTMAASDQTNVGLSWIPQFFDRYQVRVLVFDNVADMQPLSKVAVYDTATRQVAIVDAGQGHQPLSLRIERPDDVVVLVERVRVEPDGSFEYEVHAGGPMSIQGDYEIVATYDGKEARTAFTFNPLDRYENFYAESNNKKINLKIESNSRIIDVGFNQKEGELSILLEGTEGTSGVLYATFPKYLLDDIHAVSFDDEPDYPYEDLSTDLYTIIKIEYKHSQHQARIHGMTSELTTTGEYEIWYRWDECAVGNMPEECGIHRTRPATLSLNFLYPAESPTWVSEVRYFIEIENMPRIDRPTVDHGDVVPISSADFARMTEDGRTYNGWITITATADSDDQNQVAPLSILIVPEFPVISPLILATIFIAIMITMMRSKFKMR